MAEKADEKYASLAKLSLASIYFADGRADQGEAVLRDLMAHPTSFVSKEQAAVTLARFLTPKKPAETTSSKKKSDGSSGGTNAPAATS